MGRMSEPDFDALWDHGDPAGTEQKFRELLPAAETSDDRAYHAQLLSQIGRAQGLQDDFDAAHQTLDQVEKLLPGDPLSRIRYLLERGRAYNSAGEKAQSIPLFEEAFALGQEAGEDFFAIDAAHMVAIAAAPDQAIDWTRKALALVEQTGSERARGWGGTLYNNLGWTYHDLQKYTEALDCFEKGLANRLARGQEGEPVHIARWCIGRTLRSLGELAKALTQQQELLEVHDDGYLQEELGECLLALGRDEESVDHFAEAYRKLSKIGWLAKAEPDRIARLKKLGWIPAYE